MTRLFPVLALLLPLPAVAAPGEDDFVWQWSLTPKADSALYRVQLTRPVYRVLHRGDAADVMITDAGGQPVPFARLAPAMLRQTRSEEVPLGFSTRRRFADNDDHRPELELEHGGTRLVVRSHADARPDDTRGQLVFEALVAAPTERPELPRRQLRFSFLSDRASALDCRVRASDDDEPARTRLGLRSAADTRPLRLVGEVDPLSAKDAQQGWHVTCYGRELPPGFRLESVTLYTEGVIDHGSRHTLAPEPTADPQRRGVYDFELEGPLVVERIDIAPRQANVLTRIRIQSRSDPQQSWRPRQEATLSNLEADGEHRVSITLDGEHRDRFWRLQSDPALNRPPQIEIEARAEELVFLAQGQAPWRLHSGGLQAGPTVSVASLLQEAVQRVGPAWQWPLLQPRNRREGAGDAALVAPRDPLPWQRLLLWSILAAGAAALVTMSIRLLRQN